MTTSTRVGTPRSQPTSTCAADASTPRLIPGRGAALLEIDALEPRLDIGSLLGDEDLGESVLDRDTARFQDVVFPAFALRHDRAGTFDTALDHRGIEREAREAAHFAQNHLRIGAEGLVADQEHVRRAQQSER